MELKAVGAAGLAFILVIALSCGGGGAKAPPTTPAAATETATATSAATSTGAINGVVASGKQLFADRCAACHGDNASGGYKMGSKTSGDLRWAKLGDTYHNDVSLVTGAILNGKDKDGKDLDAVMPRWQDTLTDQQVSDIIAYLQTLTTDAPANQPSPAPAGAGPGEVLFYEDCAVCHGADGAGDKKVGGATTGDLRWAKLSDTFHNDLSLINRAILEGKDEDGKNLDPEMPLWKDTLTSDQVQQVIAFLQTLK